MSREGLYKALSADGNPSFVTILKLSRALGLRVHFESVASRPGRPGKPRPHSPPVAVDWAVRASIPRGRDGQR